MMTGEKGIFMRPIDADALMDEANSDGAYGYVDAKQISEAPTIDAVPVVRCRECKYHEDEEIGMVYCPNALGGWVAENWFCADGERK